VTYFFNPSIWEVGQEDCKSLASLGYIVRPSIKKKNKINRLLSALEFPFKEVGM
jgi:hypothetical protein